MEHRHEIHVIGGGLAGLAAAALAARAGHPVVLHETRNRLGGRASTDERDGFRFDQGPHALYRGGPAMEVLGDLGIRPRGVPPAVGGVTVHGGAVHTAPAGARTLLQTSLLGWRGKLELGRVLGTLHRQRASEHGLRTVADWIDGTVRDPRAQQTLGMLTRLTTWANHPEVMSADVAVEMVQRGLGDGVLYLEDGWQQLVDALAQVAGTAGVRFEAGEPVTELPDAAAVIVAAGGPANVGALVGHSFDTGPAAEVACLDLGLRGDPPHTIALGIDVPVYASLHSAPGGRAPDGHSAFPVAEYLAEGVEPDRTRLEDFARSVGVADDAVVTQRYLHRMVACTAVPVASAGGLAGRPGVEVPDRPGVFVAGDWVGPEGHLADAVLASARAAARAAVHHVERLPVTG